MSNMCAQIHKNLVCIRIVLMCSHYIFGHFYTIKICRHIRNWQQQHNLRDDIRRDKVLYVVVLVNGTNISKWIIVETCMAYCDGN